MAKGSFKSDSIYDSKKAGPFFSKYFFVNKAKNVHLIQSHAYCMISGRLRQESKAA